jgi:hypothetical protein
MGMNSMSKTLGLTRSESDTVGFAIRREMRKTEKMDRFERMVEKLETKYKTPGIERVVFTADAVAKLLRREHRATMNIVKEHLKHFRWKANPDFQNGYKDAVTHILNRLTRRAT